MLVIAIEIRVRNVNVYILQKLRLETLFCSFCKFFWLRDTLRKSKVRLTVHKSNLNDFLGTLRKSKVRFTVHIP